MDVWTGIVKRAKSCHTKAAWEQLFSLYQDEIRCPQDPRALRELFRLLHKDPQSRQYSSDIWTTLLEGCLATWELELGCEISEFIEKIACARTSVLTSRVYIEDGLPEKARKVAARALRLSGLSAKVRLQLEVHICQSYVEEGNRPMAIRLLNKMQRTLADKKHDPPTKSQTLCTIAQTNFFLGRYHQAGMQFHEAFEIYRSLAQWNDAARSLYNAATCFFSAGGTTRPRAYPLIEECRKIAEGHNLPDPMSHVEAFYGQDNYWRGNFASALEHYRRAYKFIPNHDSSSRAKHVLSMLTSIHLKTGQYRQARQLGQKVLEAGRAEEAERYKSNSHSLRAELLWEDGMYRESHCFLADQTAELLTRPVNSLVELNLVSRYLLQSAKLKDVNASSNFKIGEHVNKHTFDWLEYLYARGQFELAHHNLTAASEAFDQCRLKSEKFGDKYHLSLGLLGQIQTELSRGLDLGSVSKLCDQLEVASARIIETPIRVHILIVRAAIAYRCGDFTTCKDLIALAADAPRVSSSDKFVIDVWKATTQGKSTRINSAWQRALLRQMTKMYFQPSFSRTKAGHYLISNHYELELENYPAMVGLLDYLLTRDKFSATPEQIQQEVWNQSTSVQGWRQKIRNTINRLRIQLPYTVAPLIFHNHQIELNADMIDLQAERRPTTDPHSEILKLLREGPSSTVLLANQLNISLATTKRLLRRLNDEERITVMRVGRKVLYHRIDG